MSHNRFTHPLEGRYASPEMLEIWSDRSRIGTWRRLWTDLARAQSQLGLPITPNQVEELQQNVDNIDFDRAADEERRLRHDVMAHVHTYGAACPSAAGIIHLGATSCFVTDNTDVVLMRYALRIISNRLAKVLCTWAKLAQCYKGLPTMGFTHLQPAQPTTVGKRICLWLQDLLMDLHEIERVRDNLRFRGVKGTTGTQASFLQLFKGDHEKVMQLDAMVAEAFGFTGKQRFTITGQTYTRKQDTLVVQALAGLAASAKKMATDLRLLAFMQEVLEPHGKVQVGSSAMPHKQNPMRAERICSLARPLMALVDVAHQTHAEQWMERTLDDSAGRRMFIPEAFLLADSILLILQNIGEGLVVNERVIARHLRGELPFLVTESILMAMADAGMDRQDTHERLRQHVRDVHEQEANGVEGRDLIARVLLDPYFAPVVDKVNQLMDHPPVGRAEEQVDEFLAEELDSVITAYHKEIGSTLATELRV